jgi:CelD/BcsL family acetyltransferase involved in cellulose biosynthesis
MREALTPVATSTAAVPISLRRVRGAVDIYEIDPLRDPRWSALVEGHSRASVFHSTRWLSTLQNVYGYQPVAITRCGPGDPLTSGIVLCGIKSWLTGARFVSLPFSDHCEPLVSSADEFDDSLLHLHRHVDAGKWKYIEMRPICFEPGPHTDFGKSVSYCFHRLDLTRTTQELFRNFHKDCVQRKIRRAERENLKYADGNSEDLLKKFYRLLVMTRRRQFLPPQPIEWFRGLIAAFGKDLKIRVATKDGVAVASILTLSHKKTMVYKYGCSDAAYNRFGGTALLFWRTIQEAKENGLEDFDLGRTDMDNPGLSAFKEHWGAQSLLLHYWTYPHRPIRPAVSWKKILARIAVSAAPDLALKTVGQVLYRHAG